MGIEPPERASGFPVPFNEPLLQLKDDLRNHMDEMLSEMTLMTRSTHLLDNPSALETLANAIKNTHASSLQASQLREE